MISGTAANNNSRFPTEGETGEPTSISVNYSRLNQSVGSALQLQVMMVKDIFVILMITMISEQ